MIFRPIRPIFKTVVVPIARLVLIGGCIWVYGVAGPSGLWEDGSNFVLDNRREKTRS